MLLTEKSQAEKVDDTQSLYNRFNELQIDEQQIKKQHQEVLKDIPEAEPIFQLSHKYAEGSGSPAWRKKQMRHKMMFSKHIQEVSSEESMSLSDEDIDELPGDKDSQKDKDEKQEKKKQKNNEIQEKFHRYGERIKILSEKPIKTKDYSDLFGYQIYDGYRPQNLSQCRDYLEFLINGDIYNEEETPQHIKDYMNKDLETELPEFINQKHILRFDQNFECGNLDSAYICNCEEYNLLIKVDSNTKGNTYWFYFSVEGFRVGMKYTFNLFNFTRSMEKFYREGMNVLTKSEKTTGVEDIIKMSCPTSKAASPDLQSPNSSPQKQNEKEAPPPKPKTGQWRYGTCQNIWFEQSPVARPQVPDRQRQYYQKLSFSYTFKPEDMGKSVHFAYALPYTYSDLLSDLEEAKQNLLKEEIIEPSINDSPDPAADRKATFKVLRQKDYLDASKYKHFSHYQNDDYVPLISPMLPNSAADTEGLSSNGQSQSNPNRKIRALGTKRSTRSNLINKRSTIDSDMNNPDNKKVSQFLQQHEQIKRMAQANMYTKTSKFETQFIKDQNEGKGEMKELVVKDQNQAVCGSLEDEEGKHNFEITTDYLHYRQEVIAQSMGGLNIFQITIAKRREAGSYKHRKKHVIYIQARLHAAETHGSLIMSKIIKEFSTNFEKYDSILNRNIIKLVPMVNPDGVVLGNSRSSLAGVDLNRRWCNPNATIHPELYFLKMNMKATAQQSAGITIFCDLHGHNKNQNTFIYGCNKAPNEGLLSWTKTRLLPKIIASVEPIFDFNMCKFSQEKTKYNTARVVIWNEFKVTNSFTLETSQFGMQKQAASLGKTFARKGEIIQLVKEDFDSIGVSLLTAFKQYIQLEAELEKEFKNTGGWLKKKKLDQVTGVTARQKMEQNELFEKQKKLQMGSEKKAETRKKPLPQRHQSFAGAQIIPLGQKFNNNKQNSSRNVLNMNSGNAFGKLQAAPLKTTGQKQIAGLGSSNLSLGSEDNKRSQSTRTLNFPKKKEKVVEKKKDGAMPAFLAQFFTKNEMEKAINDSQKPIEKSHAIKSKKSKKEVPIYESDSEPSCDNFEIDEMKDIFNEALSEGDVEEQFPQTPKNHPKIEIDTTEELKVVPEETEPIREELEGPDQFDIRDQITSIDDYQVIAEQLKAAKAESKQLTEKFEKLSRQINKKIKIERRQQPELVIQTPMPFRGGWSEIQGSSNAHGRHNSTFTQNDTLLESDKKRDDIVSAGPKSGDAQPGIRQRNIHEMLQEQQMPPQPGTLFPAVQMNDQRRLPGGMATSAARANKYRARNSILNVSQFNMENGLTQMTKTPAGRQPQSHVHPEFNSQFNIASRTNRQPQVHQMLMGQSLQINQAQIQTQGNSTSPNVNYPKEQKVYNTSGKKRQHLAAGSKRMTMNLVQDAPLVPGTNELRQNPQSISSQIGNIHENRNFNQAIRNDLMNRSNFQETMNKNYNTQKKSPSLQKKPIIIDERLFQMEQQFNNHQINAAIDQNKINSNRQELQTSPPAESYQQLNTSTDWVPTINQKKRYVNNAELDQQFIQTHADEIRSPIVRIRGSKHSKARIITDTDPRINQQIKKEIAEEQNKQQANFFQMAHVSQNPKVMIKPSQIKRRTAAEAYEKPSSGGFSNGYAGNQETLSPKSNQYSGTQSAQVADQRLDKNIFIASASGKFGLRQEIGQQYFEHGTNILRQQNDQSAPNIQESDYYSAEKQFKRKARQRNEHFTPVNQSQYSKKFFENDQPPMQFTRSKNHDSFSQKSSVIPERYAQHVSSPKMNQRDGQSQASNLQQSIVNYEDPFQANTISRQGRNSQSITASNMITPQKKKLVLQNINNEAQRVQTEEDQSKRPRYANGQQCNL